MSILYEKPNRVYKTDEKLIDLIQNHYSRILDNAGLNVANPIAANIGFFNNSGKVFADPVKLGRTMIFFTRPNLNFSSEFNIVRSRIFSYFRSTELGKAVMRQLMYPNIAKMMCYHHYGPYNKESENQNRVEILGPCVDTKIGDKEIDESLIPLVKTNFMPLLSNTCISTGASRDILLDTIETEANFSGDKLKYAGGIDESLTVGELQCDFEDIYYSPVMTLFFIWIMYMHYVSKAICDPYYEYMVYRIIDYTCSIYVFMLGTDNQTIIRWVKYGGCFPITIPFNAIQHSREPGNNDAIRNLGITFAHNFMCPMDPVVLTEFNMLSGPSIRYRLANQYDDYPGDITNSLISGHYLSQEGAMQLLTKYPPRYEPTTASNSLPKKIIEKINNVGIDIVTGHEGPNGEGFNPAIINRVNGAIVNNFYGVPYITEGNKLMFV